MKILLGLLLLAVTSAVAHDVPSSFVPFPCSGYDYRVFGGHFSSKKIVDAVCVETVIPYFGDPWSGLIVEDGLYGRLTIGEGCIEVTGIGTQKVAVRRTDNVGSVCADAFDEPASFVVFFKRKW